MQQDITAERLDKLVSAYGSSWESNAKANALYSILGTDRNHDAWSEKNFFEAGSEEISRVLRFMENTARSFARRRCSISNPDRTTCTQSDRRYKASGAATGQSPCPQIDGRPHAQRNARPACIRDRGHLRQGQCKDFGVTVHQFDASESRRAHRILVPRGGDIPN
jgi:hypothetical protein